VAQCHSATGSISTGCPAARVSSGVHRNLFSCFNQELMQSPRAANGIAAALHANGARKKHGEGCSVSGGCSGWKVTPGTPAEPRPAGAPAASLGAPACPQPSRLARSHP